MSVDVLDGSREPGSPAFASRRERLEHERRSASIAVEAPAVRPRRPVPVTAPKARAKAVPRAAAAPRAVRERALATSLHRGWFKALALAILVGVGATVSLPSYAVTGHDIESQRALEAQYQSLGLVTGSASETVQDAFSSTSAPVNLAASINAAAVTVPVTASSQKLGEQIIAAYNAGRIRFLAPSALPQFQWIAQGKAVTNCGVDYRVLQTVVVALQLFNEIGISSVNRRCTDQVVGAGTESAHWVDGGGHAIDFFEFDNQEVTGGDANDVLFLKSLNVISPKGVDAGQSNCRSLIPLSNINQFADYCTHQHIDFLNFIDSSVELGN